MNSLLRCVYRREGNDYAIAEYKTCRLSIYFCPGEHHTVIEVPGDSCNELRDALAAENRDACRAHHSTAIRVGDNIFSKEAFQGRYVPLRAASRKAAKRRSRSAALTVVRRPSSTCFRARLTSWRTFASTVRRISAIWQ